MADAQRSRPIDKIVNAIRSLDISLLKTLSDEVDKVISKGEHNILELMLGYISFCEIPYPEELIPNYIHYTRLRRYRDSDGDKKATAFIEIFQYLCSQFPQLITDNVMGTISTFNLPVLYKIAAEFKVEEDSNAESCYICTLSYQQHLMNSPCSCKMKVHLQCLNGVVRSANNNKCKTCGVIFELGVDDGLLYYPSIDVYLDEVGCYEIASTDNERLSLAIKHLRPRRVLELLDSYSKETIENCLKEGSDYYKFENNRITIENVYTPSQDMQLECHLIGILLIQRIKKLGITLE